MPISPELLKIMKERMRGTMMELIGFLPVEVSKERVVAELPFRDDLTQPTGLIHAGAILTLADTAATILANQNTMPRPGKFDPSRFAMTVQLSANFVRNSSTKKIVAEAIPVHVGRRTLVVQTTVCDEDGNLFATVTTTMMPSSPIDIDSSTTWEDETEETGGVISTGRADTCLNDHTYVIKEFPDPRSTRK